MRERLAARAQIGVGGRVIRTHGDYHLGQTLHTPRGWVIIDFEGEPARPLPERRPEALAAARRREHAALVRLRDLGGRDPARRHAPPEDFEQRARERVPRAATSRDVDSTLLPGGEAAIANLLSIFELEKAIYELQYELDNRPDWVSIPVAGIRRLLEAA